MATEVRETGSAVADRQPKQKLPKPKLPKLTPADKLETEVPKSGYLTKKAALTLFAIAFGPVPGVRTPKKPGAVHTTTTVVAAVLQHLDEYTPKQQRAIKRLLEPPPGSVTIEVPPATVATATADVRSPRVNAVTVAHVVRSAITPDPATETRLRDIASDFRNLYSKPEFLGIDIPGRVNLVVTGDVFPRPLPPGYRGEPPAWARGVVENARIGCNITFNQKLLADEQTVRFDIAHEMFHCFQGAMTNLQPRPLWVIEGSAEFAAADVTNFEKGQWYDYILDPTKNLFTRSYDALGFYAHLPRGQHQSLRRHQGDARKTGQRGGVHRVRSGRGPLPGLVGLGLLPRRGSGVRLGNDRPGDTSRKQASPGRVQHCERRKARADQDPGILERNLSYGGHR